MKSSEEPVVSHPTHHASGTRALLTVLIGLFLEIAVALALSTLPDHAQAAPPAAESLPIAARQSGSPQALSIKLPGPGVSTRTWLVSTTISRGRGLVVLRQEGTSRSQQVSVQKPSAGGKVEVSVRRDTRAPLSVLLVVASRGQSGALEETFLTYDHKRNRFNRVVTSLGPRALS